MFGALVYYSLQGLLRAAYADCIWQLLDAPSVASKEIFFVNSFSFVIAMLDSLTRI